ncbi:MAG: hypothetical protein ACLQVY_09585 [Limisphaerales bacterium]
MTILFLIYRAVQVRDALGRTRFQILDRAAVAAYLALMLFGKVLLLKLLLGFGFGMIMLALL